MALLTGIYPGMALLTGIYPGYGIYSVYTQVMAYTPYIPGYGNMARCQDIPGYGNMARCQDMAMYTQVWPFNTIYHLGPALYPVLHCFNYTMPCTLYPPHHTLYIPLYVHHAPHLADPHVYTTVTTVRTVARVPEVPDSIVRSMPSAHSIISKVGYFRHASMTKVRHQSRVLCGRRPCPGFYVASRLC